MKINKSTIITTLGIMALAFAFFTIAPVVNANHCNNNCNDNYNEINNKVVIEYVDKKFPPVTGTCSVDVSRAETGDVVEWRAMGDGGDGYYSYTWSGTDGLSSVYPTITKIYNTSGTKTAKVIISSNGESVTRNCSVVINEKKNIDKDDLDGSCSGSPSKPDEDERVTWTARSTGGDGNYKYEWSGTDGLDGNSKSIKESYNDSGTKKATVRITSDGETITRTCSVRVDSDNNNNNDDLEAYCKASPNNGDINDTIKWTVYPDGGDGDYDYDCYGDNNLNGSKKSISKKYTTSGRKEAEVRVKSDGDSVTVRCYADIDKDRVVYNPPNNDGGIYLSSIPATGISPTMKIVLFGTGMLMWSAFLAYLYIARRNEKIKEREVLASIGE